MDFDGSLLVGKVLRTRIEQDFWPLKGVAKPGVLGDAAVGFEGGDRLFVEQEGEGTPGNNAVDSAEVLTESQEVAPEVRDREDLRAEILGKFVDQLALRPAMESLVPWTGESVGELSSARPLEASVALFYDKPVEKPATTKLKSEEELRILFRQGFAALHGAMKPDVLRGATSGGGDGPSVGQSGVKAETGAPHTSGGDWDDEVRRVASEFVPGLLFEASARIQAHKAALLCSQTPGEISRGLIRLGCIESVAPVVKESVGRSSAPLLQRFRALGYDVPFKLMDEIALMPRRRSFKGRVARLLRRFFCCGGRR
ncbi:hypothetical protein JTE90_026779 [Oedothorax gibbosus]|uniref:Uncharacterized protein n=1 Tax=Oedothorax gibbosus TaxID=931172 RepID=A0AAV6UQB9_9ARAC|nr:hypothetical protein JTE90_026779 [Oedothorax gibbosus]